MSEARRKRMKLSSMRLAVAGSGSIRLVTLASVLKRKCGSICACSARRLAIAASRSTRSARRRSRSRSAVARAWRSRPKNNAAMMVERIALVTAMAMIERGCRIHPSEFGSKARATMAKPTTTPSVLSPV